MNLRPDASIPSYAAIAELQHLIATMYSSVTDAINTIFGAIKCVYGLKFSDWIPLDGLLKFGNIGYVRIVRMIML